MAAFWPKSVNQRVKLSFTLCMETSLAARFLDQTDILKSVVINYSFVERIWTPSLFSLPC